MTLDLILILLIIVGGIFLLFFSRVYYLNMKTGKGIPECKAAVKSEVRDFMRSSASDTPLLLVEINEILQTVTSFSRLKAENTEWHTDYLKGAPSLWVEIFDEYIAENFPVIQQNIIRILNRKFFLDNVNGLVYVTCEKTLTEHLYHITVYWADTWKSKRNLRRLMENTAEYNRREDLAKHQPTVDEELEREMERNDRG